MGIFDKVAETAQNPREAFRLIKEHRKLFIILLILFILLISWLTKSGGMFG